MHQIVQFFPTFSLDQATVKAEGVNLEILAVRGRPANPSELLGSARPVVLIAVPAAIAAAMVRTSDRTATLRLAPAWLLAAVRSC